MTEDSLKSSENNESIQGLKRELQELTVLLKITSALRITHDLEETMHLFMDVLDEKMGMEKGTLTLLDPRTKELSIEVAHGLRKEEIKRGKYRLGEGITGRVVAEGVPMVIPNVEEEPLFLDRTKSRGDLKRSNIAFICIPIKSDNKTIGALSVDRRSLDHSTLDEDVRLLTIIGSMVAQTVRIHEYMKKEREKLESENKRLKFELKSKFKPSNIIGESKRMADVYASIDLVSQTPATVLLRGESGTGKELVAHAVHYNSDRAERPFIKISCAALPDTLLESELFGYEKGAFTGANSKKIGRFEMANHGTLFLDEIGDINASTQIKLLRVLQEKEFERLGGTETVRVNIRLITATNKDLEKEVREGRFREDLYYRLNVVPIFLPSLRERKEDIPQLVNHFLIKANEENNKKVPSISDEAMEYLMNYSWPGNVRELENAIARAVILCKANIITPDLFPIPGNKINPALKGFSMPDHMSSLEGEPESEKEAAGLVERVEELEKKMIARIMDKTSGNQRKASKLLGITERMLGYKLKKYELK